MVNVGKTSKKSAQQLSLSDLKVADKIIINTENSQYQFKVLDPTLRSGVLSGGMLGNQACKAMLLCTDGSSLEPVNDSVIKPNTKAMFLIEDKEMAKHLCTSEIVQLKLLRNAA
jgi:hypothetical protein